MVLTLHVALDGEIIVSKARDPETDACRAWQAREIMTGTAYFAREGEPFYMRMDIAWGVSMRTNDDARRAQGEKSGER